MSFRGLRHVLVVDDDDDLRSSMRLLLEDAGYRVVEAPDGKPALERLREAEHRMVVLLDASMPGIDGIQVMQAVAAHEQLATRHAYVLVTALHDLLPHVVVQLLKSLGVPVLAKPFDIDHLLAVVQAAKEVLNARHGVSVTHTSTTPTAGAFPPPPDA
ncbi:MAG TPA: response regulator [Ktedonobacterales bacterium]|jgi:CheY-like chemotaxis protein|nr:response regulator [Ktedonobacterales bacterium]